MIHALNCTHASFMPDPDSALESLALVLDCPLEFDEAGECALEFDQGRLVVLHRADDQTLSVRIPIGRADAIADSLERLAMMERMLAENYQSVPTDGVIGLCEASRSLVLVRWLANEQLDDLAGAIVGLIERVERLERWPSVTETSDATAQPPGSALRV
jgi:hypothetical protein